MLKTVMLHHIFVETNIFSGFFHEWLERTAFFETEIFCNIVNVFIVNFDQLNAPPNFWSVVFIYSNGIEWK